MSTFTLTQCDPPFEKSWLPPVMDFYDEQLYLFETVICPHLPLTTFSPHI